jgi:hypothetical protein
MPAGANFAGADDLKEQLQKRKPAAIELQRTVEQVFLPIPQNESRDGLESLSYGRYDSFLNNFGSKFI